MTWTEKVPGHGLSWRWAGHEPPTHFMGGPEEADAPKGCQKQARRAPEAGSGSSPGAWAARPESPAWGQRQEPSRAGTVASVGDTGLLNLLPSPTQGSVRDESEAQGPRCRHSPSRPRAIAVKNVILQPFLLPERKKVMGPAQPGQGNRPGGDGGLQSPASPAWAEGGHRSPGLPAAQEAFRPAPRSPSLPSLCRRQARSRELWRG